jgi:hypothetical protein
MLKLPSPTVGLVRIFAKTPSKPLSWQFAWAPLVLNQTRGSVAMVLLFSIMMVS